MDKKGFTLIELVMVIVIIGILAAVAVPKFISLRADAQRATCQSDVGAIRSALTAWYAQYNINSSCPSNNSSDCNTSGYPQATQLSDNASYFGQNYFTEGRLPKSSTVADWSAHYTPGNGTIDIEATCP